jgi:hypothetical protein
VQLSEPREGLKTESDGTLSSDSLAAIIVDALVDCGLLERVRFEEAVAVARTEIDVRKALGDY